MCVVTKNQTNNQTIPNQIYSSIVNKTGASVILYTSYLCEEREEREECDERESTSAQLMFSLMWYCT
ncbi:hypothetical protein CWE08_09630 [Aliidiomarina iranensis]|uniref:Uncharacterized protein n=1 Tax=Aliidiomarina iranensis TaxID=1434071 RepID=A0A432VTC0_9GAMM|nr:hypothetical protein CWE08_09630 [Aliidiomarina iranensis]